MCLLRSLKPSMFLFYTFLLCTSRYILYSQGYKGLMQGKEIVIVCLKLKGIFVYKLL